MTDNKWCVFLRGKRWRRLLRQDWVAHDEMGLQILADTVILAGSVLPNTALYERIQEAGYAAYAIGDCKELGLIVKATYGAAHAVYHI